MDADPPPYGVKLARRNTQGELFLISYASPHTDSGLIFAICQMRGGMEFRRPDGMWLRQPEEGAAPAMLWMARHWIPPTDPIDRAALLRSGRIGTSEGPYTTEHSAEKLVGRIMGVWVPRGN